MKKKIILYSNGSSGNHGCEALTRTICDIVNRECYVLSKKIAEDMCYLGKQQNITLVEERKVNFHSLSGLICRILFKTRLDCLAFSRYRYQYLKGKLAECGAAVSVGGDNYCYENTYTVLNLDNQYFRKKKMKTVLFGCSIEPELLEDRDIVQSLKKYTLITPRESITYEALQNAGLSNIKWFPDPAFTLKAVKPTLPEGFSKNNTIGINVSPMIIENETNSGAVMQNYIALLQHIIASTQMQIALIPHEVRPHSDDRKSLGELYKQFKDTGRVILVEDHNCMELKGYIASCRMFIGARTHATIAAYSSCVPTLAVGYSVKAKGIAKDIFGTYQDYVLPVQTIENKDDLIHAFEWLKQRETEIREHLTGFMPHYIEKAWQAGEEVRKLAEK